VSKFASLVDLFKQKPILSYQFFKKIKNKGIIFCAVIIEAERKGILDKRLSHLAERCSFLNIICLKCRKRIYRKLSPLSSPLFLIYLPKNRINPLIKVI